jgi:hypothetical protein
MIVGSVPELLRRGALAPAHLSAVDAVMGRTGRTSSSGGAVPCGRRRSRGGGQVRVGARRSAECLRPIRRRW